MARTAKRSCEQHLIDKRGCDLLNELLPQVWRLREYRPDYGLDFAVEVFADADDPNRPYETLGEHFFIQLKSTESPKLGPLEIRARGNVEKQQEVLTDERVAEIDTYRLSIETSELVTVERMGIAVPVLLVVADLRLRRCSFVCLNDYIDKVLVPKFDDYRTKKSRTVHIPAENEIGSMQGRVGLNWYAKRAKLLAAFQRFTFQYAELQYASEDEWRELAQHFARKIIEYDFWDDVEMCPIIGHYRDGLRRFIDTGQPQLLQRSIPLVDVRTGPDEMDEYMRKQDIFQLWRELSILPLKYEDVWREWFLPTALGHVASSPSY